MWMIVLVAMFAFAGTAMAQDAVCTFPNSPWPWNGALNRVAWTDNGVTFSARCMNLAETGVEVGNTEGGLSLYIDSEKTIVKMVFNETSAPIVANVGTFEGNVWRGSATSIEINAKDVSVDITYVEVYFEEEEAPAQPEPEVGADATISFLETDPSCQYYSSEKGAYWWKSNGVSAWGDAWVDDSYCYFSADEKIHVISDEKNIGKIELIGADGVVYTWTGSAKSVDLGEGAISKLVYSVKVYFDQTAPAPVGPTVVDVEFSGTTFVYVTLPDYPTDSKSWSSSSFSFNKIPVGLEILNAKGNAIKISSVKYFKNNRQLSIQLQTTPTNDGEYTVNIPEGIISLRNGKNPPLTGKFTLPVDYLTGKSIEEGKLDPNHNSFVTLYFNGHDIEYVDYTKIQVNGRTIESKQLDFIDGDNFRIAFSNTMPLVVGNYTINILKGAILFKDRNMNKQTALIYYVPKELNKGDVVFDDQKYIYVTLPSQALYSIFYSSTQIPNNFEVLDPEGNAVEIYQISCNISSTQLTVQLKTTPSVAGEYTINIPEGIISLENGRNTYLTGKFTVPANYLTGKSFEEGALDPEQNSLVTLYFNNHEIESVDCTQITVGGKTSSFVDFRGGDSFDIHFAATMPLVAGEYNIEIPEGTIKFKDGNINQRITLSYYVLGEANKTEVEYNGAYNVYVTLPCQATKTQYWSLFSQNLPIGFEVIDPNGEAVAINSATCSAKSTQFSIHLQNSLTVAGEYTVNIPPGFISLENGMNICLIGKFSVKPTIEVDIESDGTQNIYVTLPSPTNDSKTWNASSGGIPSGLEICNATGRSLGISSVSYRANSTQLTILLKDALIDSGEYTVNIPAGIISLENGMNSPLTGKFTTPANYFTGKSIEEGEIDPNQISDVALYFDGHEIESIDYTQITIGGKAIKPEQLVFRDNDYFYVSLSNEVPLVPSDYTLNIPVGAIKFMDGMVNKEITLFYYVIGETKKADVDFDGTHYVYVTLPSAATNKNTWGWDIGYFTSEIPAGFEVLNPNGDAVEIVCVSYDNSTQLSIQLVAAPTIVGEYTINVPAGFISFENGIMCNPLTGKFNIETTPVEPTKTGVLLATNYVYVTLPNITTDAFTWGNPYGTNPIFHLPTGLEVLAPNNDVIEIVAAWYNWNSDNLCIQLKEIPTSHGEYTVNIPAGLTTGNTNALTGTFTIAPPVSNPIQTTATFTDNGYGGFIEVVLTEALTESLFEFYWNLEGAVSVVDAENNTIEFDCIIGNPNANYVTIAFPAAPTVGTYSFTIGADLIAPGYYGTFTIAPPTPDPIEVNIQVGGNYVYIDIPAQAVPFQTWDSDTLPEDLTILDSMGNKVEIETASVHYETNQLVIRLANILARTSEYEVNVPAGMIEYNDGTANGILYGTFIVAKKGDINIDDIVNVGDYTTEIDIIMENIQPTSLQQYQADVNKDGHVNVGDVTNLVNIILERDTQTNGETRAAAAPAFFNLAATLISTENGIRRYALSLEGATIANFQMDLRLAEGTTLVGKTIGERSNGHYLYGNSTTAGTERILAASLMGNNLNGNAGNICYIDVAGEGEIEISDVIVADAAGRTHDVAGLVIGSETGINGIATDKAGSTIYSLDGRRTSRMNSGIYVNEGRKTIVK